MVSGAGWASSQRFRVCWNRSTLPQVVGWFGRRVLLEDAEAGEFGFEAVAAAAAGREPGGEDHAVIGQC